MLKSNCGDSFAKEELTEQNHGGCKVKTAKFWKRRHCMSKYFVLLEIKKYFARLKKIVNAHSQYKKVTKVILGHPV